MSKSIIKTESAPSAIGPYSQAVKTGSTVYISGQIPLTPEMTIVSGDIKQEATQVFSNLQEVSKAAGGTLQDIVKLNIFLTNMNDFASVNEVMQQFFKKPYPARAAIGVKELPKNVRIEADAVMYLS